MKIEIVVGDISKQPDVNAVVNSANANLRLGSGVAGAIHRAAGPELESYCRPFAPLALGSCIVTPGFKLPNAWVLHLRAAHFLNDDEPLHYLEVALDSMMLVANECGITSIAMPAIATGVFKCPSTVSAEATVQAIKRATDLGSSIKFLRICLAKEDLRAVFADAFNLP